MGSKEEVEIQTLIEAAESLIRKAEKIADESGEDFKLDIGGYGMGGWYSSGEWQASSQSC